MSPGKLSRGSLSALTALALALVACSSVTPGSSDDGATEQPQSSSTALPKEDVTLTVWDQEVRGGQNAQIEQLNKEFMDEYPNVTIKRVAKSFTDLNKTIKLAASDDNPPDVVQANQGRVEMGQLVTGGLLRPLDDYAEAYGWEERYSPTLLELNSFSADGDEFGAGNLYGLSQVGEIVGVYYNKKKLADLNLGIPQTFDDFTGALETAKQAGEIPIQFGNLDKWPGIHEFQAVQNEFAPKDYLRQFVFGLGDVSFATDANTEAASVMQQWVDAGYFTPGFNGIKYDDASAAFTKDEGVFLITGTWQAPLFGEEMGKNVGFFLMPPAQSGEDPVALGGEGLPFAITTGSDQPEAAAAYIDFITNEHATEVITETGGLPAPKGAPSVPSGTVLGDIFAAWEQLNATDSIVPYIDYATPTFYDTITASVQELMADRVDPESFVDTVNQDYTDFMASR
ncbi:MAG: extracellular solute-binding protein [Actinomycetota bacterium]|nr:extracellular solute-binding protein [Actinomycetota bacterium]